MKKSKGGDVCKKEGGDGKVEDKDVRKREERRRKKYKRL